MSRAPVRRRMPTSMLRRRLTRNLRSLIVAAVVVASACHSETSPTFEGIYSGDTLFTVEGGGVTMDVARIRPDAVATIPRPTTASVDFSLRCKDAKSGVRWSFYFLRDDQTTLVTGPAAGCPTSFLQAQQKFGLVPDEYEFLRGHTTRLRVAVAANANDLLNGGPYTYLGTRDIATWTFE